MEVALRIALILAVGGLSLWVPKYLHDHPVEPEIERLEAEVARLQAANDEIQQQNEAYRTLVRGLREAPSVLERRARETLGLSRADEMIVWFEDE
jgi:cell division protein FtsB